MEPESGAKATQSETGPKAGNARTYHAEIDRGRGGETDIVAPSRAVAFRQAREWVMDGDWSLDEEGASTVYARLTLSIPHGPTEDSWVRIDPPEPECAHPEGHDWIDGQAYGVGGGVAGTDTCSRCPVRRHWTTWANRETTADGMTGEQGVHSIHYDRDGDVAEP